MSTAVISAMYYNAESIQLHPLNMLLGRELGKLELSLRHHLNKIPLQPSTFHYIHPLSARKAQSSVGFIFKIVYLLFCVLKRQFQSDLIVLNFPLG